MMCCTIPQTLGFWLKMSSTESIPSALDAKILRLEPLQKGGNMYSLHEGVNPFVDEQDREHSLSALDERNSKAFG